MPVRNWERRYPYDSEASTLRPVLIGDLLWLHSVLIFQPRRHLTKAKSSIRFRPIPQIRSDSSLRQHWLEAFEPIWETLSACVSWNRHSPRNCHSVRSTRATFCLTANCSGHFDRGRERSIDEPCRCDHIDDDPDTFSGRAAIAEIKLIRQIQRRKFHRCCSFRTNRPALNAISFSLSYGDVDRPRNRTSYTVPVVTTGAGNEVGFTAPVRHTGATSN